jgi:DNA polymerase-3 subunit delta'
MDLFGDEPIEEIEDDIEDEAVEAAPAENLFTHPRGMNFSFGHDAVEKQLLTLYNENRMPHALVFAGPRGIGKATFAFRLAKFLFKNGLKDNSQASMFGDAPDATSFEVNPEDPSARRVTSGGHPDLLTVERQYDDNKGKFRDILDVDEVRKVAPFLRMTSSEGGWRVVIIDDADTMNRNSQNATLKILEEPPKNTLLILIAHRAGALIPTIRSRSRYINFMPLEKHVMKDLIAKSKPDLSSRDTDTLIELSEGSFGKAQHYADSGAIETLGVLAQMLQNGAAPWVDVHKLADTLSGPGSDNSYATFREILEWTLRQSARNRARGYPQPAYLRDFLKNSSLEQLLKICENLEDHFGRSEAANLDRRQTVLGAFSLLAA